MRKLSLILSVFLSISCASRDIQTARYHFNQDDLEKTEEIYSEVQKKRIIYPVRFQAKVGEIWSEYHQGHYRTVLQKISELRKRFPENLPDDWLDLITVFCHFHLKEFGVVTRTSDEFVKKYPRSFWTEDISFLRARAFEEQGNFERAAESYKRFLEIYKTPLYLKDALFGYYRSERNLKHYAQAVRLLENYLESFPEELDLNGGYLYELGFMYDKLGRSDLAATNYERYLRRGKADFRYEILFYLGNYYRERGFPERTFDFFQTLYGENPAFQYADAVEIWFASWYLEKGELDAAAIFINKVIERGTGADRYEEAIFLKARLAEETGDDQMAILDYAEYLTFFPEGRFSKIVNRKIVELSVTNAATDRF